MSSFTTKDGNELIKGFYHIADLQERQGDLLGALSTYDRALNVAKEVGAFDEIPFLACSCSRVSFRIKHYNRSCYYADICIFNDPTYVEAYWWSYKSCVEKRDEKELTVLFYGYTAAVLNDCSNERKKDFLSEVAVKIPTLHDTVGNRDIVKFLVVPSDDILESTLDHLSRNDRWLAVSLLVTGRHFGPKSSLDNCAYNCSARSISVGRLLKFLSTTELKSWGLDLAIALLKNKASFQTIQDCLRCPVLHVGVNMSLTTGTTRFFEFILKHYATTHQRLVEKDPDDRTAHKVLLEYKEKDASTYCKIESMLKDCIRHTQPEEIKTSNPCPSQVPESSCVSHENCQEYKNVGTENFKSGQYQLAIKNYEKALTFTADKNTLATLYGNLAECHLRLKQHKEALEKARKSVYYDSNIPKSQVRLGRALDGNGLFHEALNVFLTAIRSSSISSDKSKIVMYFCSSAVKIQTKDLRFPEEIFAFTTPRIWTDAAYGLITEGNWEASQFAFGRTLFMPVEDTKKYSLRPFYNLKLLTSNSWAMEFMGRLVGNGSVLSSLADGTDESFLHAYFRMILVTGIYISEALNPYVKQEIDSNESLMFDSEGNSLFHLIVKEGAHNPGIQMFLCQEMLTMGLSKYLAYRDRADRTVLTYVHGNDYGLQLLFHQNVPGDLKDDEISIQEEASETMSSLTVEKGKKLIKECKELGELQEKGGDLSSAFTTYDEALSVASETGSIEDIPCLACTCSRLSFLLKHYSESLHYADICVMHDPNNAEVYWWSYKSRTENEDHTDHIGALTSLICGYNMAIQYDSLDSQKEFLVEVATKIPTLSPSVENRDILKSIMLPSEDEAFIASTLKQLSENGKWLAVSLLVTGRHLGPKTCLDNFAHNCAAKSISVGRLLKCLKIDELKSWGMSLAIALLKNKASLDTIEECFGSPVLHIGVQLALSTGMTDLVEIALKRFTNIDKKLQEKDENGKTAYQLLLQCPDKHSQTYARLDILLKDHIRHEGAQAIHAPMGISTTQSDGKDKDECQENRMLANKFFKEGKYSKAISFYKKTISHTTSKHTLAVLYGNLAECCIRLKQFSDAIEYGEKSIEYDTSLTKSYVRIGRAKSAKGLDDEAIVYFTSAVDVESSFVERAVILTHFSISAVRSRQDAFQIPYIDPALWVHSAYLLIENGNWEASHFAFVQFPPLLFIRKVYSLRPFYNLPLLRKHGWAMEFLRRLLSYGSKLSSIAEGTDESFLHVYFKMVFASGMSLNEIFNIVKKTVLRDEDLLFDKRGDTLFHLIVRQNDHDFDFKMHLCQELVNIGMAKYLNHRNKEGRVAISYVMGNPRLRQFLKSHMPQDLPKKTYRSKERSNASGIESPIGTDESKQNLIQLSKKLKQKAWYTDEEENNIINGIVQRIQGRIPDNDISSLTSLPVKYFSRILEALLLGNKTTELLILWRRSRRKMSGIPVKFAKNCSVTTCFHKSTFMSETEQIAFLEACINGGAQDDLETEEDKRRFMQESISLDRHHICLFLIKRGINPRFYVKDEKSPLFLALSRALETGVCELLEHLLTLYLKDKKLQLLDPNQQDYQGKSLFHEVCCFDGPIENAIRVCKLLNRHKVKGAMIDLQGKAPKDYLSKGDEREKYLNVPSDKRIQKQKEETHERIKEQPDRSGTTTNQRMDQSNKTETDNISQIDVSLDTMKQNRKEEINQKTKEQPDHSSTILYQRIGHIDKKEIDDLLPSARDLPTDSDINKRMDKAYGEDFDIGQEQMPEQESSLDETDSSKEEDENEEEIHVAFIDPDKVVNSFPALDEQIKKIENSIAKIKPLDKTKQTTSKESRDLQADTQLNFECTDIEEEIMEMIETGSAWQVELAPEAVSFLRNSFVDRVIRLKTLHEILQLTSEDRTQCEAKSMMKKDFILYQSFFHESEQIIWEKAITYLPSQRTEIHLQYDRMYSQVIRIWNVLTSDKRLQTVVRKLEKVKRNSRKCTQQRKLVKNPSRISGGERDMPSVYHKINETTSESCHLQFAPLAISKRGEYNLIKFQNLTQELVQIILRDPEREATFPFNVLETEHEIIEMDLSVPIVLQGRSGTGKTTCCLYRLWKLFVSYWKVRNYEFEAEEDNEEEEYQGPSYKELEEQTKEAMKEENEEVFNEDEGSTRKSPTDQSGNLGQDSYSLNPDEDFADHAAYIEDEEPSLHQLFVTKSPFLCQQVREQLNLLMNGVDWTKEHIETTKQPLPYRLEDLGIYHYPLVLNSHQFLLMLDASLGMPYFFDRNEDLSLEYEIPGWTYRTSEGIVADSDDSEDDFDEEDTMKGKSKDHNTNSKKKSIPKKSKSSKIREVTYEVFERDVWPKIKNKASREIKCHPSMVWKEIVSFIRGSYECMLPESKGCLSLEEYIKVGRKKAPDFDTEDRKIVYELFKLYERHKRKMNYFDETDVIRFIVQRMHRSSEYEHLMFDQIYVDETQDFTLAELWLLVKFCSNPSQMFLAGDTAQAIMHGVSFRFSDLVSLFQLFDEKYKESLKILHLRENYRSHNGVLDLASSIVDIIMEYFNESFDVLDRDLGMYPGPKPAIIDCVDEEDLLLLLNSKQQKIEFGAHQVILVLDEESKKHLPEQFKKAITLTIPESKGLEFDDVLVFNFFKDSKAEKQWRIVSKFLRKLAEDDKLLQRRVNRAQDTFPRQKEYEPKQDRVLCTLLKKLYTAVSRARVNVWIYDSNEEERQHMYNYFRTRNLVETVTKYNMKDRVFTKKTSKEEWIKQGEKLMRRKIYHEAAKCFVNGKDKEMTELALAFHQMSKANKNHDRRIKPQMYLAAADRFINCGKYTEAERCLRKSRRKSLIIKLLEKTGQFERAGKLYLRSEDIPNSIRCFKEAFRYDLAIEIYDQRQMFREARSLCEEYDALQGNDEVDDRIERYQPKLHFTVDFFAYKEAEVHYKESNTKLMNEALNKMTDFKRAIDFLLQREFIEDALALFTENNSIEDACRLYLKYGRIREAIILAQRSRKLFLIAKCDILYSELVMRDTLGRYNALNRVPEDVMRRISYARNKFVDGGYAYKNEAGEAFLLLGMISRNDSLIGKAFGKFSHTYPKNLAGMLECMDWMTNNARLSNWRKMTQVILGMENLADVLELLRTKDSSADLRSIDKILDFYGFHGHENEKLVEVYPAQKPLALQFLSSDNIESSHPFTIDKWVARQSLAKFLLNRGKGWIEILQTEMTRHRRLKVRCPFKDLGEGCFMRKCELAHRDLDHNDHSDLLVVDMWFMALDFYSNRSPGLTKEPFYQSVKWFVADLMRNPNFLPHIQELRHMFRSTEHKKYFREEHPFPYVPDIRSFVVEYIRSRTQNLTLNDHHLSSEILIEILLLYNLFSLQSLENNLPINTVCDYEIRAKREFLAKKVSKRQLMKEQFKLKENGQHSQTQVQCIAHDYYIALDMLLRKNDPSEALVKYVDYVSRHDIKDLEYVKNANIAVWMEYMVTIGLATLARISRCMVFIPNEYLGTLEMLDTIYERKEPVLESIKSSDTFVSQHFTSYLMDKLAESMIKLTRCFNFTIEGNDVTTMTLLRKVVILNITLLCNMHIAMSSKKESGLVQQLYRLGFLTSLLNQSRFKQSLEQLRQTKSQRGMCLLLKDLLEGQGFHIGGFHWSASDRFEEIPLIPEIHMLTEEFSVELSQNQMSLNIAGQSSTPNYPEPETEILEHFEDENQLYNEEDLKRKFFDSWLLNTRLRKMKRTVKRQINIEMKERTEALFKDAVIDEKTEECGICGLEANDIQRAFGFEASSNIGPFEKHCKSDKHRLTCKQFQDFVNLYTMRFSKSIYECERLIDIHGLNQEQSVTAGIENCRRDLIRHLADINEEVRQVLATRQWTDVEDVLIANKKLDKTIKIIKNYIKDGKAREVKEMRRLENQRRRQEIMKAKMLSIDDDDDDDDYNDEEEDDEDEYDFEENEGR